MAAGDTALRILISASPEQAIAAFGLIGREANNAGNQMKMVGLFAAAAIAAGVVSLGVASIKMAGDFQSAVTRLYTTAGESQSNLKMVGDGILAMAGQVGTGAQQLVDAMYWVESAGFHGSQGLEVLRIAAEGAKAENSDLIPVAHALTGVLNTYSSTGLTAAQAMNVLIASTGQGAMTLGDLSGAISNVLPAANKFHLNLIDITTGIATMTNQNDNAASAATHLRQVILALESPAKAGAKALAEIGLSSQQVSDAMKKSLPDAIQMIITDLGKRFPEGSAAYNDALKAIAGGNKQLLGLLELSGGSLEKWKKSILAVKNAVDQGGNSVMGWNDVQGNFNFKIDQAKAAFGSLGIMIGSNLLPLLTPLIANVATLITQFTQWANSGHAVNDMFSPLGQNAQVALPIFSGLAVIIGGALVTALWSAAPAVWAFASGVIAATWPVLLVAGAVAGLVALFVHFYQTSAPFRQLIATIGQAFQQAAAFVQANFIPAMQQVGSWLQAHVWPILQQIGGFMASTFTPVWNQLVQVWNSQILPSLKQLWGALQPLMPVLKMIGMVILGVVVVALVVFITIIVATIGILTALISGIAKGLAGFFTGLATVIGGVVQFITGIVQVVSGVVTFIYDLLTGNFSKLGSDLGMIWQGIVNMFQGVWSIIVGVFQAAWGLVSGIVVGFVQGVIGFFQHLFDQLVGHSIIPDMVNGIVNWIAQLPGRVGTFISNMVSNFISQMGNLLNQAITSAGNIVNGIANSLGQLVSKGQTAVSNMATTVLNGLANLASQALQAGINIVTQIANGITSAIGSALGNAMNAVGSFIQSHLPHSPAKMGPLRELAYQGGMIPDQIAQGIRGNLKAIRMAANEAATAANQPFQDGLVSFNVRGNAFALSGQSTIVVQPGQAAPIYLDKRQVGQILFDYQASELRKQGTIRNR